MAGKQSFFLTGANAKIKVNDVTIAFATDIRYRIEVLHEDPRILGMYEGHSIEAVSYRVTGSLTVVKYVADATVYTNQPNDVDEKGNGPGYWGPTDGGLIGEQASIRPNAREFFDPRLFDRQAGFDIEIFQKLPGKDLQVTKLRGAKLTSSDFQVSQGGLAMQTITFQAVYADEDTFKTRASGLGQQFQ